MRPIVINGTVLCDKLTGIPRYVYEVVIRLDTMLEGSGLDVRLVYRDNGRKLNLPPLKNIKIVPLHAVKYFYSTCVLPWYTACNHAYFIGLSSDHVKTKASTVVLHDIRPLLLHTDKLWYRIKFYLHCRSIRKHAEKIYTVSENQKQLICEALKISPEKVGITYNGWEHMNQTEADENIFGRFPGVQRGNYFFALGSLAHHKNYKWIQEVARRNPDKNFVVAGGADLRAFGRDENAKDCGNVTFVGYVSDGEAKALMQHCKAFIHPAFFEGFGIPPLEALSQGAKLLLSNASCLPELYEDCAAYFDPYDYDVDLDALLAQPVADGQKLLERYSWDKTAEFWYQYILEKAKEPGDTLPKSEKAE